MKNLLINLKNELINLQKASEVLEYSYEKCKKYDLLKGLNNEELESFDALTGRFARLSDIIIQKIFRLLNTLDLEDTGTVRDRINRAEKKNIIHSADEFIEIRILKNEISHEYQSSTIYSIFEKVLKYTPILINSVESVIDYSKRNYDIP